MNDIILFENKRDCSGCGACKCICPKGAISMIEDEEGFFYPRISNNLCVGCGKCLLVCPLKRELPPGSIINSFAVKHKDDNIRASSKSGGLFTIISDYFLENGGVVFGAIFDPKSGVVHKEAKNELERNKMRGSKYVQSNLLDTFEKIKLELSLKKKVLFCGTPCQVAGLKSYLGKDYDELYTVDIICHGVPSPKVFRDYIKWIENNKKATVVDVCFSDKKAFGWKTNKMSFELIKGNKKTRLVQDYYRTLYSQHCIVRPSCYNCKFMSLKRPGELTIGDYWGVERYHPDFCDSLGVSLLLINNEKGKNFFELLSLANASVIKISNNEFLQPALKENYETPKNRDFFWNLYQSKGINYVLKKYTRYGVLNNLKYYSSAFVAKTKNLIK